MMAKDPLAVPKRSPSDGLYTAEEVAEALNPKMLIPVLAVPNDVPPRGALLRLPLPSVDSLSVLAFKSVVSKLEVVDIVETGFDGAPAGGPKLKIGATRNEDAAEEVETIPLEAEVVVVSLVETATVVEVALLVKLFPIF